MTTTPGDGTTGTRPPGFSGPLAVAVAALNAALDDLAGSSWIGATPTELGQALTGLTTAAARLTGAQLQVAAQADRAGVGAHDGASSVAAWWAHQTRATRRATRSAVKLAHDTEPGGPCPLVGAVLTDGLVLEDQARAIVRAVADLPAELDPVMRALAEKTLVDLAGQHDADALRILGRGILTVVAPDVAEDHERRTLEDDERRAWEQTRFTMTDDGHGMTHGRFTIPTAQAHLLRKILLAFLARERRAHTHHDRAADRAADPAADQSGQAAGQDRLFDTPDAAGAHTDWAADADGRVDERTDDPIDDRDDIRTGDRTDDCDDCDDGAAPDPHDDPAVSITKDWAWADRPHPDSGPHAAADHDRDAGPGPEPGVEPGVEPGRHDPPSDPWSDRPQTGRQTSRDQFGPDCHDHRSHEAKTEARVGPQALGEAFLAMLEAYPTDAMPHHGGVNPTLVATLTLDQLTGHVTTGGTDAHHPVTLDTGQKVTAGQARRWACSAGIIPAVLGTASVVLDMGRRTRFYNARQRLALALRDGGCTTVGCDRPPAMCQAHHMEHWVRDHGPSDLALGRLLCWHHHRLIHDPAYTHDIRPDGKIAFTRRESTHRA